MYTFTRGSYISQYTRTETRLYKDYVETATGTAGYEQDVGSFCVFEMHKFECVIYRFGKGAEMCFHHSVLMLYIQK